MSLSNNERRQVIRDAARDRSTGDYRDYESARDHFADAIFAPVDKLTGDSPRQTAADKQSLYDHLRAQNG